MHLYNGPSDVFDFTPRERHAANRWRPFPKDLPASIGQAELARIVADSVDAIESGNRQGRLLLGMITHSYVIGIYGSEEIERSIEESPDLCRFRSEAFASGDIRAYRRHHRPTIERCVAEVLRRAWKGEFSEGEFAREAAERVNRAIQEDSWALDF